jgi:hypothetical protein
MIDWTMLRDVFNDATSFNTRTEAMTVTEDIGSMSRVKPCLKTGTWQCGVEVRTMQHGKLVRTSPIPSFRPRQKPAKQPATDQHFREPLHQRQQPMLRHVRDQFVEHAPLAEQRVGARL